MCRWLVYCGDIILLSDLLVTSNHSLLKQALPNRELFTPNSEKSCLYDAEKHLIRNHIVCTFVNLTNGDGFGVGWYTHSETTFKSKAHNYKSVLPAWNDKNLLSVCEGIKSDLVFAHVRASSGSNISRENCHPFKWGSFSFMHNGSIASFAKVKRTLHNTLSDVVYNNIEGTTDSETAFALFLNFINPTLDPNLFFGPNEIASALKKTIKFIISTTEKANAGPSSLNLAVSDGYTVVCTRFRNCQEDPPSLYYAFGSEFSVKEEGTGDYEMKCDGVKDTIIIASEPLSTKADNWELIPRNHMIISYPKAFEQEGEVTSPAILKRNKQFLGRSEASIFGEKKKGDNAELSVVLKEIKYELSNSDNNS